MALGSPWGLLPEDHALLGSNLGPLQAKHAVESAEPSVWLSSTAPRPARHVIKNSCLQGVKVFALNTADAGSIPGITCSLLNISRSDF